MPVTLIRSAAGFALLVVLAAGCGTTGAAHSPGVPGTACFLARPQQCGQPTARICPGHGTGGRPFSVLFADVGRRHGRGRGFPRETVTIDGHQHNTPPASECGFNQEGVYSASGMTNTSSGDHWAQLTVITGGVSYAFNPSGNDTISGLGDGAYWDAGTHTLVIRQGRNVLQVIDEVPVNLSASPDLLAAYRQAAHALATKILSHE